MQLKAHCDHRIFYPDHTNFISQVHFEHVLISVEVFSFKGINYQSHAKILCTFKSNSQCHDSAPLMAL